MDYSWQIVKFDTRDQTNSDGINLANAVVRVKWKRTGIDADGNTGRIVGYTNLSAENVPEASFVAFESLTEETVVGWIESTLSSEKLSEYNNKIQDKINKKFTTERAVPWV